MRNSLQDNRLRGLNFSLMLAVLFLMEFARGMFILSYLPVLPTTGIGVSVGITSLCITLHFVSDALMNFSTGFLLRRFGTKVILNTGFLLAVIGLVLVIFFHSTAVLILTAVLLGIAVCPIWVVMLSSVQENKRAKQMGYVYFAWLVGMMSGMIVMNLIFKLHPNRYTFLMAVVAGIGWVLYFFVHTEVSFIDKKSIKAQVHLIGSVMKQHCGLFPGILFQGLAIGMLVPILPTYAINHLKVTTLEYTYLLIAGGIGCTVAMLFISKWMDVISRNLRYAIITAGFLFFGAAIYMLSTLTTFVPALVIAAFIGLFYGLLLPGWNTFLAENISEDMKEESWGVFNSLQGFGTMFGPVAGGLAVELFRNVNFTLYLSAITFTLLALFYSGYFFIHLRKARQS
ncbi:lipoteichoic acid biosynthesis MFS flippase LtaA [Macrococcus equipercicus]|uniref:Quinolone resistance protein NorA n=1 Tax=Macrococcus equipercicus TaxID=69967 RepID=A0A9Q9BU41_9STAP|nr:MFS transporter [Macrococcus equipercicus]KAA1042607.1 MFS transporter [Macrococcus equipercicus]UTH14469.1 MFS transporter [Macrococcus equipercicus]